MPWIFLCLMMINAVYFGWKFLEGQPSQAMQQVGGVSAQIDGAQVALLSERPSLVRQEKTEGDSSAEVVAPPSVAAASLPSCFYVGPFGSDSAVKELGSLMESKGFEVRMESRKVEEKDFWVFIPPFTSREKAEERLRELRARGVEGFVVRSGVFINSISLNHFSKKELAMSFRQQMSSLGISVEYREIKRPGMEFWLYLASRQGAGGLRATIDESLRKNGELRREVAACEK